MTDTAGGAILDATERISIPRALLTETLPQITDVAELQVTLALARLALDRGSIDEPVEEGVVLRDRSLRRALRVVGSPNEPDRRIGAGLELATGRGTLLRVRTTTTRGAERIWYLFATAPARALVQAMATGAVAPPAALWHDDEAPSVEPDRPTIFRLYEQNIGLLTPLLAEQLVKAMETYPRDWIEDAIAESVSYNKRNWRYIQRILQQWAIAGRGDQRT